MPRIVALVLIVTMVAIAVPVGAQDSIGSYAPLGDESGNFTVETILDGLKSPAGITVRAGKSEAGAHELFVAESGAGRVIRVATDKPQERTEVITGFKQIAYGEDPAVQLGPTGLVFLTSSKLVVCGGGLQSSPGVLSVFVLSDVLADEGTAIDADQSDHTAGPLHAGDSLANSKRIFLGVAKTETALFSTWGDSEEGWILKSGLEANRLAYLQALVTPRKNLELQAPTGIAINPNPWAPFLAVTHRGNAETPRDSKLSFYQLASGSLAMSLETGLHDISALAYSPTGQLYAADFARDEEASGGVYRLDDAYLNGQQTCQAIKIASIARPTALVFASDGTLYVTAFGASEDESKDQGLLVKITGEL